MERGLYIAASGMLAEQVRQNQIANDLAAHITHHDQSVLGKSLPADVTEIMTRTDVNTYLSNTDRANICNAAGADTVISIHLNAASDPTVDYFRDYYGKRHKDGSFTQVIWDNYLLSNVNDPSQPTIDKTSPTQFASGLLLKTNAPATLAETVFLTNPAEQSLLGDGTGHRQQQIANQLYNGLVEWYQTH